MNFSKHPWKNYLPPFGPFSLIPAVLAALLLASCSSQTEIKQGPDPQAVVARVNDQPVHVADLLKEIEVLKKKFRVQGPGTLDEAKRLWLKMEALNPLIQNLLFEQEAKKNGIVVSPGEFEEVLAEARSGYDDESFQQALESEGISLQEWKNKLKNNVLIKKLINQMVDSKVTVSEEELLEYFDAHPDEFEKGEQVRALHIMVETEEQALKIKNLLGRKGNNFEELAREHSIAPEGPSGGDMGFLEADNVPVEFDTFFKLNVNQISNVIKTPYGSHIFKVIEKRNKRKMDFEEAKNIIQNKLTADHRDQAFQEWITRLKENARIEIDEEIFAKIT